jgi:hypothetical protein
MAALASRSCRSVGRTVGLVAWAVAAGGLVAAVRAEPAMTEVTALARAYGAGVHAYFCGDAQRSYDDLTQAIEAGTRDPRAWYFRGLAALKLGRLDEAEADFSTGAVKETEAVSDWGVSRSLERVQGHDRLALERHRVRARVAGLEQRRQAVERRYSQIESRQSEVLRQRRPEGVSRDPLPAFGGEELPADPARPLAPAEEMPAPPAVDAEPFEAADPADAVELPAEREEVPAERVEEAVEPPAADAPAADVFE